MPRSKKPTELKILQGTARKDRQVEQEPAMPKQDRYDPPAGLDGLALKTWQDIEPVLSEARVLSDADVRALEAYCIHYSNLRKAQEHVDQNGFILTGATGGSIKNPACTVVKESSAEMRALSGVLGLDPAARTRINVGKKEKAVSGFAALRRPSRR